MAADLATYVAFGKKSYFHVSPLIMVRFEKYKSWNAAENVLFRYMYLWAGQWAKIGTVPPKLGQLTYLLVIRN